MALDGHGGERSPKTEAVLPAVLPVANPKGGYAILILRDLEEPGACVVAGPGGVSLESDAELALVRFNAGGQLTCAGLALGAGPASDDFTLMNASNKTFISIQP